MPQSTDSRDLSSLFDDGFDLEQAIDDRFNTEGIDTENGSWIPETPTQTAKAPVVRKKADTRTAEERIDDLFSKMGPQRRILIAVLSVCGKRVPFDEVDRVVGKMQQFNASVYSTSNFCAMLEAAGALKHVVEDGTPYRDFVNEPEFVVVDGLEFLKPRPAPKSFWEATDEGTARVAAHDPYAQLAEIYGEFPHTLPIYKRVLSMLAESPDGVELPEIAAVVDDDPLVQKPRFYAGHFLERLERADAVEWRGAWCITDVGRASLKQMDDVADPGLPGAGK